MFDDDDFDDYFVDSEPDREQSRQETARGHVIEFGAAGQTRECPGHSGSKRRSGCLTSWLVVTLVVIITAFAGICYFRYLSPVVDDAVMDVYVTNVQRRGVLFKTVEADIVVADCLVDTTAAYTHPVGVTVADDVTAHILQSCQATGRPVRVRYCQYASTLPWRGESKTVVTGIVHR